MPSDTKSVLFQTAIRYLGYRDRFKKEIETRLKKQIIKLKLDQDSLALIPDILSKLERAGLINDQELISSYIKNQQNNRLRGPYFIKQKLMIMGAPRDKVDSAIKEICTQESQETAIGKLLAKYQPDLGDAKQLAKFQRLLTYRGFSSSFSYLKKVK
jgi:SOS response regulatory protein OraA/RecX